MKLSCKVIEDILPMYYDGICSEESAALVEEHLKDCPYCSQMLSDLHADITVPKKKMDDMKLLKKIQKSYKKMRLGWLLAILCILVLIPIALLIGVWRFWPQSFSDLITVDETSIISFSVHGMLDRLENGQPVIDMYHIDDTDQQNNTPDEIIEILETSSYRQDFRNLLPWGMDYVDADKNYDGRTVTVSFYIGNQKDEYIQIQFLSSSIIAVFGGGKSGFCVYHPTNHETIDQLVEYLQTHGIKQ